MRKDFLLSALLITLLVSCSAFDNWFGKDDSLKSGEMTTAVTDDG